MKTDIQIAQEAKMLPIAKIAQELGVGDEELELFGKYKAKGTRNLNSLANIRQRSTMRFLTAPRTRKTAN